LRKKLALFDKNPLCAKDGNENVLSCLWISLYFLSGIFRCLKEYSLQSELIFKTFLKTA